MTRFAPRCEARRHAQSVQIFYRAARAPPGLVQKKKSQGLAHQHGGEGPGPKRQVGAYEQRGCGSVIPGVSRGCSACNAAFKLLAVRRARYWADAGGGDEDGCTAGKGATSPGPTMSPGL